MTMAVSSQERYDKLYTAYYNFLVKQLGYRLIRISDLGNTDVVNILSLPQHPTWSRVELNDGSWEYGMPISHINDFQKLVQNVSKAKIDLEYNPLSLLEGDIDFHAAHGLNGIWLEARATRVYGIPRCFYMLLIYIQRMIAKELGRHLV
ncbi:hypothetical protein TSTA_037140 [Talaromyces stipitatus ATCC 10500]|uniref:Uncharacterized protein n=1 Tax=Talaromyces stipitatus (strain ATCC 10500 / CBS 375.48 / QM 6759 / NRRL 1006) TaxID=441959 RepID=B8M8I1_TALSN|nr:uncharacterized protein TSTA_037140 [Talaromyces stipitatus ATCC 10500]EED20494.1 hypothetical protein TSTA_037140 [Talaromyces stipitatus ATCC 10500]